MICGGKKRNFLGVKMETRTTTSAVATTVVLEDYLRAKAAEEKLEQITKQAKEIVSKPGFKEIDQLFSETPKEATKMFADPEVLAHRDTGKKDAPFETLVLDVLSDAVNETIFYKAFNPQLEVFLNLYNWIGINSVCLEFKLQKEYALRYTELKPKVAEMMKKLILGEIGIKDAMMQTYTKEELVANKYGF